MHALVRRPDPSLEYRTPERCQVLETWNDASDPGASIARVRVAAGVTTQLHRLRGVDERYLIAEGTGSVRIGDAIPEAVRPGDVVVIPAGTPQQISNTGHADLVFYCVCTPRYAPACYESLE